MAEAGADDTGALLERVRGGDAEALGTLLERHRDFVRRVVASCASTATRAKIWQRSQSRAGNRCTGWPSPPTGGRSTRRRRAGSTFGTSAASDASGRRGAWTLASERRRRTDCQSVLLRKGAWRRLARHDHGPSRKTRR